jgi:hypothetical protein
MALQELQHLVFRHGVVLALQQGRGGCGKLGGGPAARGAPGCAVDVDERGRADVLESWRICCVQRARPREDGASSMGDVVLL